MALEYTVSGSWYISKVEQLLSLFNYSTVAVFIHTPDEAVGVLYFYFSKCYEDAWSGFYRPDRQSGVLLCGGCKELLGAFITRVSCRADLSSRACCSPVSICSAGAARDSCAFLCSFLSDIGCKLHHKSHNTQRKIHPRHSNTPRIRASPTTPEEAGAIFLKLETAPKSLPPHWLCLVLIH